MEDIVTILSTYKSRNVGTNCQNIVDQTGNVCQRKRGTDLAKLAIFATHLKNSWGKCIHEYASDCKGGHLNAYRFENTVDFRNNAYNILAME